MHLLFPTMLLALASLLSAAAALGDVPEGWHAPPNDTLSMIGRMFYVVNPYDHMAPPTRFDLVCFVCLLPYNTCYAILLLTATLRSPTT